MNILYLDFDGTMIPNKDSDGSDYIDWKLGLEHIFNKTIMAPLIMPMDKLQNLFNSLNIDSMRYLTGRPMDSAKFIVEWSKKFNISFDMVLSSYPYPTYQENRNKIEKKEFCWRKALMMLTTSMLSDNCYYYDSETNVKIKTNEYYKIAIQHSRIILNEYSRNS